MFKIETSNEIIRFKTKDEFIELIGNEKIVEKILDGLKKCIYVKYKTLKISKPLHRASLRCKEKDCFFRIDGYCQACNTYTYKKNCVFYKTEDEVKNKFLLI